jgi:hypothetical protein
MEFGSLEFFFDSQGFSFMATNRSAEPLYWVFNLLKHVQFSETGDGEHFNLTAGNVVTEITSTQPLDTTQVPNVRTLISSEAPLGIRLQLKPTSKTNQ